MTPSGIPNIPSFTREELKKLMLTMEPGETIKIVTGDYIHRANDEYFKINDISTHYYIDDAVDLICRAKEFNLTVEQMDDMDKMRLHYIHADRIKSIGDKIQLRLQEELKMDAEQFQTLWIKIVQAEIV